MVLLGLDFQPGSPRLEEQLRKQGTVIKNAEAFELIKEQFEKCRSLAALGVSVTEFKPLLHELHCMIMDNASVSDRRLIKSVILN